MLGPEGHLYDPLPTPTSIRIIFLAPGKPDDDVSCFLFPCDLDMDRAINPSVPRSFESMCVALAPGLNPNDAKKKFMLPVDSYIDNSGAQAIAPQALKRRSKISRFFKPESSKEQAMSAAKAITETAATYQFNGEPNDIIWDMMQLARLTLADGKLNDRVQRHPFQRFSALSYVWGSVEDPACITINQTKFWVTRNLYNALKAMRRPDVALSLWVDAICINQNDPEEKKVQIGLMRRIYQQAQKVTAYVPQTPEDAENFGRLVQEIIRADAECKRVIESGIIPEQVIPEENDKDYEASAIEVQSVKFVTRPVPLTPTGTCLEDHGLPPEDDPIWAAWRAFFASPYFRRIWILQEYALGSNLHYRFGQRECNADIIFLVMNAVENRSRLLNAHYLGRGENGELTGAALLGWWGLGQMTHQRVFTRQDIYGSNSVPSRLIDKLGQALLFDSTDSRDKIYGLFGLVSDAEEFMDLVSYQAEDTYLMIYRRFTRRLIEKGHLMEILRLSSRTPMSSQLPSWVPDLSAPTADTIMNSIDGERGFQASGNATTNDARFDPLSENRLILNGRTISTITFRTSPFIPQSSNSPISTGVGRIQDLFETMLEVYDQLNEVSD